MPIIAFEGLDGVGKTTMAEHYEATGGIVMAKLAMNPMWARERRAVNAGTNADKRFEYFLRLNRDRMVLARWLSSKGETVALDSSVYRTVATHRALGSVVAQEYKIEPELCPDHTLLLDLDEFERTRRLRRRDNAGDEAGELVYSSHWDRRLHELQADVREEYNSFGLITLDAFLPESELLRAANAAVRV